MPNHWDVSTVLAVLVQSCDSFLGGIVQVCCGDNGQARILDNLLGIVNIRSLQADHKWDLKETN